jgi:hypothetical protein
VDIKTRSFSVDARQRLVALWKLGGEGSVHSSVVALAPPGISGCMLLAGESLGDAEQEHEQASKRDI